jgi:hypothetical protein
MEISDFIKKSLNYFDIQNDENKIYSNKYYQINDDRLINKETNEIIRIEREVLGVFYHDTQVFIWSWVIPNLSINETKVARELLNYGLKLDPKSNTLDHYYLKTLLVNSRIHIKNDIELNLIQAISSYLLKDKIDFIYAYSPSGTKILLTTFYIIKNI